VSTKKVKLKIINNDLEVISQERGKSAMFYCPYKIVYILHPARIATRAICLEYFKDHKTTLIKAVLTNGSLIARKILILMEDE